MMIHRRSTWTGAVLSAVFALVFTLAAHADELREEFHQTYPLAVNGQVMLANINGNVQITAWDRNEVKVDAVKRAVSKERLNEAKIVVETHPDSINIKTEYPRHENTFTWGHHDNPASVEYTVMVPRTARLQRINLVNGDLKVQGAANDVHADAVNGHIEAVGLIGHVDLSTVNGPLNATFDRLSTNTVKLNSVNGSLTLTLPSNAEAEISATTVNGHISNDFGLPVRDHRYVGHDLRGKLGNGGTRVSLNNVNGAIDVRHAADGKPLSKGRSTLGPGNEDGDSRL